MSEGGRPQNYCTLDDEIWLNAVRRKIKERVEQEEKEAAIAGPSIFAPLFARLKKSVTGRSVTLGGQKVDAERALFELELIIFGNSWVTWRDFHAIKDAKSSDLGLAALALSAVSHKLA
ncbi:MAG: hypothetical protein WHU54_09660, partial [Candidatus Bathyarchaeia archaeon]